MLSRLWPGLVLALTLVVLGCKHTPAPYPRGDPPPLEVLLKATSPQLDAILVSDADVVVNRLYRGDLALLAQAPRRFNGSVTKSGNELITLAFHEQGYSLRNKFDQSGIPTGYYAGPPDECAIEVLLGGIRLPYEGLVALVLGGGPVLDPPYQILEQKWDKKEAYERLVIANDDYVEELRFAWVQQQWRFTGAAMYRRGTKEKKRVCKRKDRAKWGALLWSLEHDKFGRVGDVVLPGRTRVRSPGQRRDNLFVITYKSRDTDPDFARPATAGDDGAGKDDGAGDWGGEDDGGWEDDDGWEDEAPAEGNPPEEPASAETPAEGDPEEADPTTPPTSVTSTAAARAPAETPLPGVEDVPKEFRLTPSGLTVRGDLCR